MYGDIPAKYGFRWYSASILIKTWISHMFSLKPIKPDSIGAAKISVPMYLITQEMVVVVDCYRLYSPIHRLTSPSWIFSPSSAMLASAVVFAPISIGVKCLRMNKTELISRFKGSAAKLYIASKFSALGFHASRLCHISLPQSISFSLY